MMSIDDDMDLHCAWCGTGVLVHVMGMEMWQNGAKTNILHTRIIFISTLLKNNNMHMS